RVARAGREAVARGRREGARDQPAVPGRNPRARRHPAARALNRRCLAAGAGGVRHQLSGTDIALSSNDRIQRRGGAMNVQVTGLLGLIVLVLDVYAIVKIVGSGASTGSKVLWVVLILLLPFIGLILWWLLGPGSPVRDSRVARR